ncbi:MAG: VOC family protein [Myxococcota bacterium]
MIDHLTISVTDLQKAISFYEKALKPLGYSLVMAHEQYRAFGEKGKPTFWIKHAEVATPPMHLAFVAKDRAAVDAFYKAALSAGAQDFGAPGLRPHYHQNYYGAFVIDPMGHPIEAVCHKATREKKKAPGKRAQARKTRR